jgi:LysM repeat protein
MGVIMSGCASTNAINTDSNIEGIDSKHHVDKNANLATNKPENQKIRANLAMTENDNSSMYVIKSGDTLSGIASRHVMTFKGYLKCLESVNNLTDTSILKIGEKLTIPSIKECKAKGME